MVLVAPPSYEERLRDKYAGQAMQGMIGPHTVNNYSEVWLKEQIANAAFDIANTMMEVRKR